MSPAIPPTSSSTSASPSPEDDSGPVPLPASATAPGNGLWSDSGSPAPATAPAGSEFSGLLTPSTNPLRTIGHIGRYALKYQLGEGGLGTVFAAHDPLLSRLIAVKTLNVEVPEAERESFNTLFINEARAAGGLSHPHIVTVFDAGISDRRAYIAMEMLKGRDLRQLRREGWRATPAQAALIVRRVADALAFAHSKGVIHRDIKPANIFMVGRTQPRVLDFGIARVANRNADGDPHSGAGSPYYMSPEQVRREPADRRADVYSLGVVLYELLTDRRPFQGATLKEIREAVLGHEAPLAHEVDANVPKALAEICARAMAKVPEQRFRSARSFARELRQWLDANPAGPEGEAPAHGTTAAPKPPARPRRLAVWGASALATLALAAAGAWWWTTQPEAALPAMAANGAPVVEAAPAVAAAAPVITTAAAAAVEPVPSAPAALGAMPSSPVIDVKEAAPATSTLDTSPTATAARTAVLSTPEALMSVSLGLINAPVASAPLATGNVAAAPARETPKERRAREARERDLRERAQRAANAAPAVLPTGTVRIAISPWGTVEVDGITSGAAPPLTELTLPQGRHQIVVRNGDFAAFSASVDVVAGQSISLRHRFGS